MTLKQEFSAGGIVGKAGKVLLVQVRNLQGEIKWTFPKGHLEQGETPLQAAMREVEEETGWRCRNLGRISRISYRFHRAGHPVFKRVTWYRMEPLLKTGRPDADEIRKTCWATIEQAGRKISYPSDIRVLARYQGTV